MTVEGPILSNYSRQLLPRLSHFLKATQILEDIKQLISPHTDAIGIFKRIEPHLRDLETLVGFASTAYTACRSGTVLGNIFRATIDTQMKRSSGYHIGYFPAQDLLIVVHEWWTGHEPEEIRAIRSGLSKEVTAIGERLRSLYSFWWASSQLLTTGSSFTMDSLHDFLEAGPIAMLRQILIKEIVVLEPLQGEPRSIPIRFVETFEDVHLAVTMACQGTAAIRFIVNRQYQLDEFKTDVTVSEGSIVQRIDQCRVFEITITFPKLQCRPRNVLDAERATMRRVGMDGSSGEIQVFSSRLVRLTTDFSWQCGVKFNAYASTTIEPGIGLKKRIEAPLEKGLWARMGDDVIETVDLMEGADDEGAKEIECNKDDEFSASNAEMAKLFRRVKFKVDGFNIKVKDKPTFGIDIANQAVSDNAYIPPILVNCCEAIEKYGIRSRAIYRLSGSRTTVAKPKKQFDHAQAIEALIKHYTAIFIDEE
ncbi:hypothetical protein BKA70DRAFT_1536606 [Coprinopsis sp. MPI-PUGE-AT-0042]|nr:hypothetical protein BKA70DRAFT_1536606 [Coprinopsis sp. MPI-PUGE-AT-0042]